jgi:hypothetical protein
MVHKIFLDSASIATKDLAGLFEEFGQVNNHPQILSISTIGNACEPLRRWSKADSQILQNNAPSSQNRVNVADLLTLGELYRFLPVRWEATKLTPIRTGWIPIGVHMMARKLALARQLAKDIRLVLYREVSGEGVFSQRSITIVIPARNESGDEPFLRDALVQIQQWLPESEDVLVEGNSTDNTFQMLKQIGADFEGQMELRVIRQDGQGKKNVVICGFKERGDVRFAIINCVLLLISTIAYPQPYMLQLGSAA